LNRNAEPDGEILFEFTRIGAQMRVAAIHSASGTEVVVIAPANATQQQMQQIAIAKLKRRISQNVAR
jgi:Domain of unknown function (DUF6898)